MLWMCSESALILRLPSISEGAIDEAFDDSHGFLRLILRDSMSAIFHGEYLGSACLVVLVVLDDLFGTFVGGHPVLVTVKHTNRKIDGWVA